MKKLHKVLGMLLAIALVVAFCLLPAKMNIIYQVHEFNDYALQFENCRACFSLT